MLDERGNHRAPASRFRDELDGSASPWLFGIARNVSLELRRAREQSCGPDHVAYPEEAADVGRGNALERRNRPHIKPEPSEQFGVARRCASEAEALADDDDLRSDLPQERFGELRGLARRKLRRELDHEDLVDIRLLEQLDAAFEGREQLHSVSEHQPRMWPERHDRDGRPRGARGLQHPTMTAMHAVEAADRCDAFVGGEFLGAVGDSHSRANASSAGMKREGSASSTENGPISSRRNVRQWPPRASAIART